MKLIFEKKDIEKMLLEKAWQMGIEADTVEIDSNYGVIRHACVFKGEKKQESEVPAIAED